MLARFSDLGNSNICIKKKMIRLKSTFFQNAILSLIKIKTNIRSLPVKELLNSITLYLYIICYEYIKLATCTCLHEMKLIDNYANT